MKTSVNSKYPIRKREVLKFECCVDVDFKSILTFFVAPVFI